MQFSEIIIAVFLGLILLVASIYLTHFSCQKYKKKKEVLAEGEYYYEEKSKKGLALNIVLYIYLSIAAFVFITNMVYRSSPYINNQYYVSVNSNSMAAPLSSNTYLVSNNLKNQIAQYDVAVFDKLENQEIKLYDIVLFKRDNKLIVHRVVEIVDENSCYVQGDNNPVRDEGVVNRNDLQGIYKKKLTFMSFVNYLGYTPGLYVSLAGVTYLIASSLTFEILNNKLDKKYKQTEEI